MDLLEGPSSSSQRKKRNRRKITRKNPLIPKSNSSSHHIQDDETMLEDALDEVPMSHDVEHIPAGIQGNIEDDDDNLIINVDPSLLPQNLSGAPTFAPVTPGADKTTLKSETRRIPIPPHRMTPLKKDWLNIFGPLTEILGLQVRMNVQRRSVEIRVRGLSVFDLNLNDHEMQTSKETKDIGSLQKGADFIKAYALGFDVNVRFPSTKFTFHLLT